MTALGIPQLDDSNVGAFTVCGKFPVAGVGADAHAQLSEKINLVAEFPLDDGGTATVEIWHESLKDDHFHVNVYGPDHAGKVPKLSGTARDIQKVFGSLANKKFNATATGLFAVSLDELPKGGLIRTPIETVNVKEGGVRLQQTGAHITVTGGPLRTITWTYYDEEQSVLVEIEISRLKMIDEGYLTGLYGDTVAAFNRWVLEKNDEPTLGR